MNKQKRGTERLKCRCLWGNQTSTKTNRLTRFKPLHLGLIVTEDQIHFLWFFSFFLTFFFFSSNPMRRDVFTSKTLKTEMRLQKQKAEMCDVWMTTLSQTVPNVKQAGRRLKKTNKRNKTKNEKATGSGVRAKERAERVWAPVIFFFFPEKWRLPSILFTIHIYSSDSWMHYNCLCRVYREGLE